jgi:polar amino acid transport system substrate-binding protein
MMKIIKKIKKFRFKKILYWLIPLLALLLLFFSFRSCSMGPLGRKTTFTIGREAVLQIEALGRERNLIAFMNDLMATIGEENDLRFRWVDVDSFNLLDGLVGRNFDFALTTLRPNIVNQERYDFSEPIFDLGPVLIVRSDSRISSLKQMGSRPIGIAYGFNTNFNALRSPGINTYDLSLVYYTNMNRALDDLIHDQIDGIILKSIAAYAVTQGLYASRLKIITAPLNDEGYRIISLKSSSFDETIDIINQSINKMREDGRYKALINKWSLIDAQSQYGEKQ